MGCVGSVNVDHDSSEDFITKWRKEGKGKDFLLMGIKDQNKTGKVYFSGAALGDKGLVKALDKVLKSTNEGVREDRDDNDKLWDLIWHDTKLTSGYQRLSLKKPFFPIGKHVVKLLDTLGQHGFVPCASPNYGGPWDQKYSVFWPMIIFKKDNEELYEKETLLLAIKDQNNPGKLCACGPAEVMSQLKGDFFSRLKKVSPDAKQGFDEYDTAREWDVVWRDTSLTSGMAAFSIARPYFPKGKVIFAILEEIYKLGWQLVCGPNFGGKDVNWPCFVFKRLKAETSSGALAFGVVKDSNIPGKFCITASASEEQDVAKSILESLKKLVVNSGVKLQKDDYDADHGQVIRNTCITTGGLRSMAWELCYFPRCDSLLAITRTMGEKGWKLEGCPSFGGMGVTWPGFVWRYTGTPMQTAVVAIKFVPGKVCIGGVEKELASSLLSAFQVMSGPEVERKNDQFDSGFAMVFHKTKMTRERSMCSGYSDWWPYGYPMEVLIGELQQFGWEPAGGPTFGGIQLSWPVMVFQREARGAA